MIHSMEKSPLRVIIAEDSALIQEGIARLIEESGGTVVAKVGDGDAFVYAVETHRPDGHVVPSSSLRRNGPGNQPGIPRLCPGDNPTVPHRLTGLSLPPGRCQMHE
jgi:hypothetical protein